MKEGLVLFLVILFLTSLVTCSNGNQQQTDDTIANSYLNNHHAEPAVENTRSLLNLKGILKKTKGLLKLPTKKHFLTIDYKLLSRSKVVQGSGGNASDKKEPLYRGRAVLNYQGSNNRMRLISTSSLLQKTIYYDSEKLSFTDHDLKGEREDLIVPTSDVPFHKFFQALHEEMMSGIAHSNYIPSKIPIYDEAVDRLCPIFKNSRHLVYFGEQYYVFCIGKETISHKNEDEAISANLLLTKFIIAQEFIVEVTNTHSSPIANDFNSLIRGVFSEQKHAEENFNYFVESPTIQEELKKFELKYRKKSQVVLKDLFPKERALFTERSYTPDPDPDSSHFFSSISCKIPYIRGKLCKETESLVARDERKICFFLHGAGQWPTDKGEPIKTDYTDYWGPMSDYTPQCSERWYIREETKYRGWDNLELQQSYCNLLLLKHLPENANRKDTVVKNAIIFAHSMGNLILAGAIKNGICGLEKESTSWYNIQGPMRGSKAAHVLQDLCENRVSIITPGIAKVIAAKGGYCLSKESNSLFPTYDSLKTDFPGMSELVDIATPYIKGEMCGTSPSGLNTIYSPALAFLSNKVNYGEPNDGMVSISSCHVSPLQTFTSYHYSQNYLVEANHADGTCKSGDAWFGSVKPCTYYLLKK